MDVVDADERRKRAVVPILQGLPVDSNEVGVP